MTQIAVMTFTNKAAGELKVRFEQRVSEEIETSETSIKYWEEVKKYLPSMFIGTIHGFLLKLIKEGYFSQVSPEITIINEFEIKLFIKNKLEKYLNEDVVNNNVLEILRLNQKALLSSFFRIFNDSELRLKWEESIPEQMIESSLDSIIESLLVSTVGDKYFKNSHEYPLALNEKTKWADYLKTFSSLDADPFSLEGLKVFNSFFGSFKPLPSCPKKYPEYKDDFANLKELRNFVNNNLESFESFEKHKNDIIKDWLIELKKVFNFLNKQMIQEESLSFSELEYIVYKGLREQRISSEIQKSYKYFIIDEFQDTSQLQFEIIRSLVAGDFKNLFCVGDLKQAIYGFRGGEVSVFKHCIDLMPAKLQLSNNYRSYPEIINFNNSFFTEIFKLKEGFLEKLSNAQEVDTQTTPLGLSFNTKGEVFELEIEYDTDSKIKTDDINKLEAMGLLKSVQTDYEKLEQCILYKKLAPSVILMELFIENNLSFTSQVKVPLAQEPILGVVRSLLELILDKKVDKGIPLFHIGKIFEIINFSKTNLDLAIHDFHKNFKMIGLMPSLNKFIFSVGLGNSLYDYNMKFVEILYKASNYSLEDLYMAFKNSSDQTLSIDFQYGKNPGELRIMTTHASKGLEFEKVLIAGIYTNGRSVADHSVFGKTPGSFKWKPHSNHKKFFKSPLMLLETAEQNEKDFAEDKRLFYVACTRAISKLGWVRLNLPEKTFSIPSNSWINAINYFRDNSDIKIESYKYNDAVHITSSDTKLPMFHKNIIGVVQKPITHKTNLLMMPELSVTRLSSITQCPRKFYFSNILKLTELSSEIQYSQFDSDQEFEKPKSSAERGDRIHNLLSVMIKRNNTIPVSASAEEEEACLWVQEQLREIKYTELVSEVPIKFPVQGHMISGIPDLIIKNETEITVWDFKTGALKEDIDHYWCQLKLYAYACYKLGLTEKKNQVKLALVYLDEKKIESMTISFQQTYSFIEEIWALTNNYSQVNKDHCKLCMYGNLCRF